MKKIVMVTGSSGYIGRLLCHALIEEDMNVIQLDKKFYSNILYTKLEDYPIPHAIVHLATPALQICQQNPEVAVENNIMATSKMIKHAEKYDIPFIMASSQAAATPKESIYAFTKFTNEHEASFHDRSVILRFANIYGGQNYILNKTSVIANFMNAYLSGKKLRIDGDGSQERDFIHVNDVIKSIILSIHGGWSDGCRVYDIGTGIGTSIFDVAKMFIENEENLSVEHIMGRMTGVESNIADTIPAKKQLGFSAKISLPEFIKNFKEHPLSYI